MTMAPILGDVPDDIRPLIEPLDDRRKAGCAALITAMGDATGMPPTLWSGNIIGFGSYRYRYESGREGESCALGFSPRAREFSLYLSCYLDDGAEPRQDLLERLGKVRMGKGCLYLKDPTAADREALAALFQISLESLAMAPVVVGLTLGPDAQATENV